MSFGIPDDFKELVRDRTNLVDLVSESVQLQSVRGGQDYVGLCPFHEDRNPSMHVYPDRNGGSYRCWVCQHGGDCYSWVQEIERLTFPEAIEYLAERLNLEVPRQQGHKKQAPDQRKQLFAALQWAETEMHNFLRQAAEAAEVREYLTGRGYGDDIIQKFHIGYHPNDWNWLLDRARGKFTNEQLLRVRLIGERESGGFYDNFVDRLIFPIRDDKERPIAFGGRVLPGRDDSKGKYWNSPESDFFPKSKILYGFDIAKQAIRKSKTAFVVEGYTDCISCHQHGIPNAVASMGTALTNDHVAKIKRFGKRVVIVYDGDEPGQNATEKAIAPILAQEIDLRVLILPGGVDPADFLDEHGAEAFHKLAEEAPEAIDFKFDRSLGRHGIGSIAAQENVRNEMMDLLVQCPNLVGTDRMDIIMGRLARKLGTEEWRIRNTLEEHRKNATRRRSFSPVEQLPQPAPVSELPKAESDVLEILLIQPDQLEPIRAEIGGDDFNNLQLRSLFERILDLNEGDTFNGSTSVLNSLDEDLELKKLTVALADAGCDKDIEKLLNADVAPGQRSYLESVLNAMKLRRTERQTELSKHHLSSAQGDPDSDTLDALRRLQQAQLERMRHPTTLK